MPRDGTHRIRTIDPDFWRHPKTLRLQDRDPTALLLLIGIRSAVVDDAGRFRADEHYLKAEIMPLVADATPERIRGCLQTLEGLRFLHLYEADETCYGVIHDWSDWQYVQRPTPSRMPSPPPSLCRCCGGNVPESERKTSDPSPQTPGVPSDCSDTPHGDVPEESGSPTGDIPTGEEGRGEERRGGDRRVAAPPATRRSSPTPTAAGKPPQPPGPAPRQARSRSPAGCSWCASPTDPGNASAAGPQRLMQVYHDAYREHHGECPVAVDADWAALKRLLRGKTFERLAAVIRHGVLSEDPLIVRSGHRLAIILSNYQGIAEALDGGETHGVYGAHRRPSGRATPTPAEGFGAGGATEF